MEVSGIHIIFENIIFNFYNHICYFLFVRYPKGHLHELPSLWLKETLGEIANENSKAKLCATRRSAGIPFIIQVCFI